MRPIEPDPLLTRVLHWIEGGSTVQFFWMVAGLGMYILGNLHGFMDPTMLMILEILQVLGVSAIALNALSVVVHLIWGIHHRCMLWGRMAFALVSLFLGVLINAVIGVVHGLVLPV